MSDRPLLVLDLQIGAASGWNVYALNLAKHAAPRCRVGLTCPPKLVELSVPDAAIVAALPLYEAGDVPPNAITITGLGNHCENRRGGWPVDAPDRRLNVGVIFSEDTVWTPTEIAMLNTYDLIVAGSTWNADVLKANGVRNVATVFQGVDLDIFRPGVPYVDALAAIALNPAEPPPPVKVRDPRRPFRVFSGGKLEYRKGQDIVVAAFKQFHAAYPDSHLVVAWDNHWPTTMQDISVAGHTVGFPLSNADIPRWLRANGVTAFENIGMLPHYSMGNVLRSCDVAVFPNRAEGGTNLVAMEALACGVPTIVTSATGQRDLPCLRFIEGVPIMGPIAGYTGTDGWAETSPTVLAQWMQNVAEGHVLPTPDMTSWSWPLAIGRLLDNIGVPK